MYGQQLDGVGRSPPRCQADPGRLAGPREGRFRDPAPHGPDRDGRGARGSLQRHRPAGRRVHRRTRPDQRRGRQGRQDRSAAVAGGRHRRMGGPHPFRQFADRRPGRADAGGGPRHRRRCPGGPVPEDDPGDRRPAAAGGVLVDQRHRQHHGRPARLVRLGGHPGGPRGRHRGQAGRTGRGAGASPAPGRTSPTASTSWPPA